MPWILTVRHLPGLYTREDVRDRLRIRDVDDVSKIVKAGLLPLLNEEREGNERMWFWAEDVERRIRDRRWMVRMIRVVEGPTSKSKKSNPRA